MNALEEKAKKTPSFAVASVGAFSRGGFNAEVQKKYERLYTPKDLFEA